MKIAVIGAGASGIVAALQAAWHGATVILFERNAAVGRKLLVTGSGRCNITNEAASAAKYACADQAWMDTLLDRFGVSHLLLMLTEIGIPLQKTPDGWYYPLSDSAHSVVEAFSSALDLAGVTLWASTQVTSIRVNGKHLTVHYLRDGLEQEDGFERVILSAGGAAYPTLGSRGELFPALERLGHTVLPKRPALAPLVVELGYLKPLQGMRLDVGASLWDGPRRLGATRGNCIITPWGLNGPAVMDLSHHVSAHAGAGLSLSLDHLAFFQEPFDALLAQKRKSLLPLRVFLDGFFPPKAALLFLKDSHLPEAIPLCQVTDGALERLIKKLKDTRLAVKGVKGFEYCQVSAGGVPVGEVDPQTLESRRVEGLYLTGETLDVVGPCGGYNLQFAFSSGALAGIASSQASLR